MPDFPLLLAIDTCGPTGSVALGRIPGRDLEILGQTELAGRTYSATLISAIAELLHAAGFELSNLDGIVVVNGPGSFTGVRVGVSAAKGLAQGAGIPVVAISRLEILSRKSGVPSAALDAHRGEVFLRLERTGAAPQSSFWPAPRSSPPSIPSPLALPYATKAPRPCWPASGRKRNSSPRLRHSPLTRSVPARRASSPALPSIWHCSTATTCAAPMPRSSAPMSPPKRCGRNRRAHEARDRDPADGRQRPRSRAGHRSRAFRKRPIGRSRPT